LFALVKNVIGPERVAEVSRYPVVVAV